LAVAAQDAPRARSPVEGACRNPFRKPHCLDTPPATADFQPDLADRRSMCETQRRIGLRAVLAAVIGIVLQSVAAAQPALRTDQVRLVFREPTESKHVRIRALMQERRIPEALHALLSPFRLPRVLTIEVKGCDGSEDAFYDNETVVFCYEYAELIERHLPKVATPWGVPRADAIVGAILDTILHEVGHGVIEMLDIPILGREEDAADFFSVYLQLLFPVEDAQRLLQGVAFMMGSEAREDFANRIAPQEYAGAHALNAQRYYNVLCLAFGANPKLLANAPPAGLPDGRAKSCGDEYALLKRAFLRLIVPYIDEARQREAIAKVGFSWSALVTVPERLDRAPLQ
jgi:hypothetical protein